MGRKANKVWENNRKSTTSCKSGLAKQELEVGEKSGGFVCGSSSKMGISKEVSNDDDDDDDNVSYSGVKPQKNVGYRHTTSVFFSDGKWILATLGKDEKNECENQ